MNVYVMGQIYVLLWTIDLSTPGINGNHFFPARITFALELSLISP